MFVKVTKTGTRKYVHLVESYRAEDGTPKQRTVATLGRLDKMDRSLGTMLQGLMRATGAKRQEKWLTSSSFNRHVLLVMSGR